MTSAVRQQIGRPASASAWAAGSDSVDSPWLQAVADREA